VDAKDVLGESRRESLPLRDKVSTKQSYIALQSYMYSAESFSMNLFNLTKMKVSLLHLIQ